MNQLLPILTVSQLNRQVKIHLESALGFFQVEGEVSNLSRPASGHAYFTLKDATAQVRCVFFKGKHRLDNPLKEGQSIVVKGSLTLYEARGDYQLVVVDFTPAGLGALYQRFEALKAKLTAEGLFEQARKKPLPRFPKTIGLITSPSGAAIQDMLSTLARRFPMARICIYPCEVQGERAAGQLIKALQQANADKRCDVLIMARGGGSLEDLWAFNEELLARAIAASDLPLITGIGHETDFSIADFVADFRAETPTAAANAATPDAKILAAAIADKILLMTTAVFSRLKQLDHQLGLLKTQLQARNPAIHIPYSLSRVDHWRNVLIQNMRILLEQRNYQLTDLLSTLHAVSPLATLNRGYAIASYQGKVLYKAETLSLGNVIDVRLAQGRLSCQVQEIIKDE